jgi:competence protein ComEC
MAEDNSRERAQVRPPQARALAIPTRRLNPVAFARPHVGLWLSRNLAVEIEQRRLFPWIAACFGLGILFFFEADGRPALWAPVLGLCACLCFAVLARSRPTALAVLIALGALFAGFSAAVIRSRLVEAPVLRRIAIVHVAGYVEAVEDRPEGARLVVRLVSAAGLAEAERPRRIRVTSRPGAPPVAGTFIEATARLVPPPEPVRPGGYDFARDAYFRGIGAVGTLVGPLKASQGEAPDLALRLAGIVDEARNALTRRIAGSVGGQAGAVAAALVTGKRGLIDDATNGVLRAAGIYHIVSISGLHMVLAAGSFFFVARAVLALFPGIALYWPVKKIAAVVGMAGAVSYCIFSGSEVATERSMIMTLVMFGAILVDRPALSMRNCALAALIVLAREPETLLGPSFQMSFGAVAGLVALAPAIAATARATPARTIPGRAMRLVAANVVGLLAMTLVATIATAPFSAYHFQTLNPLGLIGNTLALPLVSVVVMPSAVLGVIAYPFGLDRLIWQIMGLAVEKVLDVSSLVAGFDGSVLVLPALGVGAFSFLCLALLCVTLPVSQLRWLALVPAGAGLALALAPQRFDLLVDRGAQGAAIRGEDGRLVIVGKPSQFVIEQWLRADGDRRSAGDESLRTGARCDRAGCVVRRNDGLAVAFVTEISALEEDCTRAAAIVTRLDAPPSCDAGLVLDRKAVARRGALAANFEKGGWTVRSARAQRFAVPWAAASPDPPSATRPATQSRTRPVPPQGGPDLFEPAPDSEPE